MIIKNSISFEKLTAVLFLLLLLAFSAFGQMTNLAANQTAQEKTISSKQTDAYQIAFKKGEFAQIRVEQKGADVAVDLLDASGKKLIERDSPNGTRGAEILSFVAEADVYKIEVKLLDENAAPGKYSIALITKTRADEKDLSRIEAEKALQDALALRAQNTPESIKAAAAKFAAAVAAFQDLGDKYFESLALSSAVFLEPKAENETRIIADLKRAVALSKEAGDEYLEILTTSNIADYYAQINQPEKAREIYTQTAERARLAKDEFNERYAWNGVVNSYYAAKDWQKVAEINEQKILPLVRQTGNRAEEADWLNILGVNYSYFDNNRAVEFYQRATAIYQELKLPEKESLALNNLGYAFEDLKDYDRALENYRQALKLRKSLGLDELAAKTLESISGVLVKQEKYAELITVRQETVALYEKLNNRAKQAEYLNLLGVAYDTVDEREKGAAAFEKSLEIYRTLDDKQAEQALLLKNLGNNFSARKDKDKAVEYYRQSADLRARRGDTEAAAAMLDKIAEILRGQKKPNEAIAVREEIVRLYRNAKDAKNEAVELNRIGVLYTDLYDRVKTRQYFNDALRLAETTGDKKVIAQIWYNLAAEYNVNGEYAEAISYYRKSYDARRELGLHYEATETLLSLAIAEDNAHDAANSDADAEQALELAREKKFRGLEAQILIQIASRLRDQNRLDESLARLDEALQIVREIKNKAIEADVYHNLSLTYAKQENMAKALETERAATAIYQETGDQYGVIASLDGIANMYNKLGDYKKARELYNETLQIARRIGSRRDIGKALMSLGSVADYLEESESGIKYSLEALPFLRETGNKRNELITIINLGGFYAINEDNENALKYLELALPLARELNDEKNEAHILMRLALIEYLKENTADSRLYLQQVLFLTRKTRDRTTEASALSNLFSLEKYYGDVNLAIFYGKQAVNIKQQLRSEIKGVDKDLQKSFLEANEDIYRKLANLLIGQGRILEAQAVLDLLKDEEFSNISARRGGAAGDTLPYSKAEEATVGIVEKIASVGRELSELKAQKKTRELTAVETERLNQLEFTEIPAANKALKQATEALGIAAPDIKDALDRKMKDNIQNILPDLGSGVVALYTVFGQVSNGLDDKQKTDVGWILLVTPEFRKAYPIDTKDLNKTVAEFRAVLKSDTYDPQPLAEKIYQKLFLQTSDKQKTTLAADLETYFAKSADKTLMWSLDGVLRYVPMAALHDGKTYLVEKYRNVVFNTASLGSLKDKSQIDWKVLGLGVSEAKTVKTGDGQTMSFDALKGAESELHSIVKDTADPNGILPGTIKLNKDFTKIALLSGVRDGSAVVHIASHFSFNPANEEKSFLLLGDGTPLEMSEFEDFPNLFAGVDLLSLSACDTATGGAMSGGKSGDTADAKTNGKEVEGFAYVAQTLGAKSVMASLWQVSDEGTKELMLNFYRIRQANRQMPKAEALREAQIALLKGTAKTGAAGKDERTGVMKFGEEKQTQPPYKKNENAPLAHPYYWSPFILIGNWR